MTGSALIFVFLPIVALVTLGVWLGMIFYADAHPDHRAQSAAPGTTGAGAGADGPGGRQDATSLAGAGRLPEGQDAAAPGELAGSEPARWPPSRAA